MRTIRRLLFCVAITLLGFDPAFAFASLPMIAASGSKLVDPNGSTIILKGCNLGNYLMLESWMFGKTLGVGPDHSVSRRGFCLSHASESDLAKKNLVILLNCIAMDGLRRAIWN